MAEDGDVLDEIPEEEEEENEQQEQKPQKQQKDQQRKKKPCNQRIDELATPNKRIFLDLYTNHAQHFPKDKIENLKTLLQQLYAMTPEESMRYFEQRRSEAMAAEKRKKFKQMVRCYLLKKRWQRQRECGLRHCKKILKKAITYAVNTPSPPIISERLRILSDIVLEHLAVIMGVSLPDRLNPRNEEKILIAISDWMAILIERLYYDVYTSQIENYSPQNESQPMLNKLEISAINKSYDSRFFEPRDRSLILSPTTGRSPRQSRLSQIPVPTIGQPQATSTPRQSIKSDRKTSSKMSTGKATSTSKQSLKKIK